MVLIGSVGHEAVGLQRVEVLVVLRMNGSLVDGRNGDIMVGRKVLPPVLLVLRRVVPDRNMRLLVWVHRGRK